MRARKRTRLCLLRQFRPSWLVSWSERSAGATPQMQERGAPRRLGHYVRAYSLDFHETSCGLPCLARSCGNSHRSPDPPWPARSQLSLEAFAGIQSIASWLGRSSSSRRPPIRRPDIKHDVRHRDGRSRIGLAPRRLDTFGKTDRRLGTSIGGNLPAELDPLAR